MPRLFISIKIKDQESIFSIVSEFKKALHDSNIKWVENGNYHLTIKFLGETDSALIDPIDGLLRKSRTLIKPFPLIFRKINYFGSLSQPRVLVIEYQESADFLFLHNMIDESLAKLGFPMESKAYRPHLTLGRIKHLNNKEFFVNLLNSRKDTLGTIEVTEFQLFESKLKSNGPEYIERKLYKFES